MTILRYCKYSHLCYYEIEQAILLFESYKTGEKLVLIPPKAPNENIESISSK